MRELEEALFQIRSWLERRNLPAQGVELKLVLKDSYTAFEAATAARSDLPPMYYDPKLPVDGKLRIAGLILDFTSPDRTR